MQRRSSVTAVTELVETLQLVEAEDKHFTVL